MIKKITKKHERKIFYSLDALIGFLDLNSAVDEELLTAFDYNINDKKSLILLFDKYVAPMWIGTHKCSPKNMINYIKNDNKNTINDINMLLSFDDRYLDNMMSSFAFIFPEAIRNNREFLNTLLECIKKYHKIEFDEDI